MVGKIATKQSNNQAINSKINTSIILINILSNMTLMKEDLVHTGFGLVVALA